MSDQFSTLEWKFEYNDRGTHSGNYLDKLNQLVSGFNTTINAYNAQLAAETDSATIKTEVIALRDEALDYRNQASAISTGDISGTAVDFSHLSVSGIDVALVNGTIANAEKLGQQPPSHYAKQSDIDALTALLNSDQTSLDSLQEIVNYIQLNRADLESLSISSIAGLETVLADKAPSHSHPYASNTHNHDSQYLGKTATASNANKVGGLSIHSGRNNNANKMVRTDSSGYLQTGWINTTSGSTAAGTLFACFNSTSDMYLRYMTAANMRTRLGVDSKIIHGSNSNGKYTKFADGTLIAYGSSISIANGGSSIALPISFLDDNVSVVTTAGNSYHLSTVQATRKTYFIAYMRIAHSSAAVGGLISYIAIGRWK